MNSVRQQNFRSRRRISRLPCFEKLENRIQLATFQGLGDLGGGSFFSDARDASHDGTVVVGEGRSALGNEAYHWSQSDGMVGLGDLPGKSSRLPGATGFSSIAQAVSGDGSVVVGSSESSLGTEAFSWSANTGMVGLGDFPGGLSGSSATDVSADGTVIVGRGNSVFGREGFRWTSTTGMVSIGDLPGGGFDTLAEGVSADGSTVVGSSTSELGFEAFRWTHETGIVGLGDLPGGIYASIGLSVSEDGSVVVGEAHSELGTEAFRWTQTTGMVGLTDLPGGMFSSRAEAVSDNGSITVGRVNSSLGFEAVLWDSQNQIHLIKDLVSAPGWQLRSALGVSGDGLTVVGVGTNPSGQSEAWIARLDPLQTDIAVLSLQQVASQSIEVTIETLGNPAQFELSVYGSPDGINYDPADLVVSSMVTSGTTAGEQTIAFNLSAAPNPGQPYVVAVVDPSNSVLESNEQNNSVAGALTDIAMLDVVTDDFVTFQVRYQVLNADAPPFQFQAFLSQDEILGPDDTVIGSLEVSDSKFLATDPNVVYLDFLKLNNRADIGESTRFVLVRAVLFESNEEDNDAFAIPQLRNGERLNRAGEKGFASDEQNAESGSGPFTGAILPGTVDFGDLNRLDTEAAEPGPWPSHLPNFTFSLVNANELPNEDRLGQPTLRGPLDRLVGFLMQDLELKNNSFSINEAYDSTGGHSARSLHYEGRALDLDLLNVSPGASELGRYAGLAWLAGFDWVLFENNHVHVSVRGKATTLNEKSLDDAIRAGNDAGTISKGGIAAALTGVIDGFDVLRENQLWSAASGKLIAFSNLVRAQAGKSIEATFAALLLENAMVLREQINQSKNTDVLGIDALSTENVDLVLASFALEEDRLFE